MEISVYANNINIQFCNVYPYLITKLSDLFIKIGNYFNPKYKYYIK